VDQIVITHGAQQALGAVAALLTSPTQAVALEQPGYPGAQQAFTLAQARVLPLPVTPTGWELDALRDKNPAALYVIPHFQNPTGRLASDQERLALARFGESTGAFIVEDDTYGELDFTGCDTRPLLADTPSHGILLGTFSKTLCPGLRVGWVVAPSALVTPLVRILQASSLQPGTLTQHLALGLLERLDWQARIDQLRAVYRERAAQLRNCCLGLGFTIEPVRGGFFLWVNTPGEATALARDAAAKGLLAVPESGFRHPEYPRPDRHLRLAFTRFSGSASEQEKLRSALAGSGVL
jgi:DNA-binding transcriptional MocR family regulator